MSVWLEEPTGEEFDCEIDETGEHTLEETLDLAKQISRRVSMATIVKWLYNHSNEAHKQIEITKGVNLNHATVSWNLARLSNVGVVSVTRLDGLDNCAKELQSKKKRIHTVPIQEQPAKIRPPARDGRLSTIHDGPS